MLLKTMVFNYSFIPITSFYIRRQTSLGVKEALVPRGYLLNKSLLDKKPGSPGTQTTKVVLLGISMTGDLPGVHLYSFDKV